MGPKGKLVVDGSRRDVSQLVDETVKSNSCFLLIEKEYKRWASRLRTLNKKKKKLPYELGWRLHRRLLLGTRHLAPDFLDEIPLRVEGTKPIQCAIGSVEGGKLDLVSITLALMKIGKPLPSLQFDEVIERGAVFEVSHRGADSYPSPVEVSLGST